MGRLGTRQVTLAGLRLRAGIRRLRVLTRRSAAGQDRTAMEATFDRTELTHAAPVANSLPEDDLAFFNALWFWVPAGLALWAAVIWMVTRVL